MNLYHIKLTEHQKDALEHLFSLDIDWNKTELEKAWTDLREHIADATQCVAIIKACKPKYDPNREFREGDMVRVRKIHGKLPQCRYNGVVDVRDGDCCTIHKNGGGNCYWVTISAGIHWLFDAAYLELVTPVEDLEPYMVKELKDSFIVYHDCTKIVLNDTRLVCKFMKASHPNAQAAAEAECARMNAEHRKEQA